MRRMPDAVTVTFRRLVRLYRLAYALAEDPLWFEVAVLLRRLILRHPKCKRGMGVNG